jgi:cytochrome c2
LRLRKWLKDPAAMKPSTQMPNLGLSDEDIEDLIAFLLAYERPET